MLDKVHYTAIFNSIEFRFSQTSKQWEAIDQWESSIMVAVTFEMDNWKQVIEVGQNWTLLSLRQEVLIILGHAAPDDFTFMTIFVILRQFQNFETFCLQFQQLF